ncbi:MAG: IreB family regulatory phosphoprotein [Dysosmobacter welbionis]
MVSPGRWCLYGRFYQKLICHGEGREIHQFSRPSIGRGGKAITPSQQIVGYILSEGPTYITITTMRT